MTLRIFGIYMFDMLNVVFSEIVGYLLFDDIWELRLHLEMHPTFSINSYLGVDVDLCVEGGNVKVISQA